MKKLLSISICVLIALGSQAQQRMFSKHTEHKKQVAKLKQAHQKGIKAAATGRAPQVEKFSIWDLQSNTWIGNTLSRKTYTNGLLTQSLELNYAGTDTIGRQVYSYDAQNRTSMVIFENYFMGSGTFAPSQRIMFTRTSGANETYIEQNDLYDIATSTWIPNYRLTRVSDDRGNERLYKYEQNNGGNWFTAFAYSTYITYYNSSSKMVLEIDSAYEQSLQQWVPQFRSEKEYNAGGEAIKIYSDEYIDNQWQPVGFDSLVYTPATGIPFELYSAQYDTASNSYVPFLKFNNITWINYNANIDIFDQEPDAYTIAGYVGAGVYVDVLRFSTTRPDAFGSEIELQEEFDGFAWTPAGRFSLIFDSNKNILEESSEVYDAGSWSYDEGTKWQNSYDGANDLIEIVQSNLDQTSGLFVNEIKLEFSNYIGGVLGIGNSAKQLNATLYPNPSNDGNVYVNLDATSAGTVNYRIISMNGQEMEASTFEASAGKNTFSLPTLDAGFYIVHLQCAEGVSQFKVIVK